MIIDLKKNYVYESPEGVVTTWNKDVFDIEVLLENINPSEKIINLRFRFVNKVNGLTSSPIGIESVFSFDRNTRKKVKNAAEINSTKDKVERVQRLISATEQMNSQLEVYKQSNELGDDEKLKIDSDIAENLLIIDKQRLKLESLIVPEPILETSEDFNTVVREYFSGFELNEKGKTWIEKLVNSNLSNQTKANLNNSIKG